MPNLVAQSLTADGLFMQATNGNTITLTKAQIQAFYQTTSGNAASRRAQVIDWVKQQIVDALGADMIDPTEIDFDIDGTRSPTLLQTRTI